MVGVIGGAGRTAGISFMVIIDFFIKAGSNTRVQ